MIILYVHLQPQFKYELFDILHINNNIDKYLETKNNHCLEKCVQFVVKYIFYCTDWAEIFSESGLWGGFGRCHKQVAKLNTTISLNGWTS